MSQTRRFPLAVHYVVDNGAWTPAEWRTKTHGTPSPDNLKKHCLFVEAATKPGGVNAHVGETKVLKAWIVDQVKGTKIIEYIRENV